jgi:long-chain acyl-CoA synthetase
MNLVSRFFDNVDRFGDRSFLGAKIAKEWQTLSWNQTADQVSAVARELQAQGVAKGDRVLLLAENRPEWAISDLAIMSIGAYVVPAYTTHSVDDLRHILSLTDPVFAIVSSQSLADRVLEANVSHECVKNMIVMEHGAHDKPDWHTQIHAWPSAEADEPRPDYSGIESDDICALIFTSGTGGHPKAAMITHRNITHNVDAAAKVLEMIPINDQDRFLSFLPLAHAYEHTAGLHMPISQGAEIFFCESTDKLAQYLTEVSPTIATAVPRLYDMLYAKIRSGVDRAPKLRQALFYKTLAIGSKRIKGESLSLMEHILDPILEKLVRHKLRGRFGGKIKYFVSGGAPLNPEIGDFFTALGVGIIQGYGQTEASPLIAVNRPGRIKMSTVGESLDCELRLSDEGELLVRGDNVMKGYWRNEAATAMTVIDGWLHTGDLAEIDDQGYVTIVGRSKDLIVTSGGENVAPAKLEAKLTLEEEIEQAVVLGDARPWLSAIIVPSQELVESLSSAEEVEAQVAKAVKRVNAELNSTERIRKYITRSELFSIDNGYVTPTQKIKRSKVIDDHSHEIELLYGRS